MEVVGGPPRGGWDGAVLSAPQSRAGAGAAGAAGGREGVSDRDGGSAMAEKYDVVVVGGGISGGSGGERCGHRASDGLSGVITPGTVPEPILRAGTAGGHGCSRPSSRGAGSGGSGGGLFSQLALGDGLRGLQINWGK